MNTETGEIRELTDEQLAIFNGKKPGLWVPIQDKELERVLRKLSKKERKIVMERIKPKHALADSQPPQEPPVDVRECLEIAVGALQKISAEGKITIVTEADNLRVDRTRPSQIAYDALAQLAPMFPQPTPIVATERLTLPVDDGLVDTNDVLVNLEAMADQIRRGVGTHSGFDLRHVNDLEQAIAALQSSSERERGLRDALEWYATEAEAVAKYSDPPEEPLTAIVKVLSLDGGRRARRALKEQP